MFATVMVHEKIPPSLYVGDVDEFNSIIDELGLRDSVHTKIINFIRDEGGEKVFIVPNYGLIIQKKKAFIYKGVVIRPEPKMRVVRGDGQLRAWFALYV